MMIKIFRDDQLKDRVSQKFQTLVIKMISLRLVGQARMGQRLRQQKRIAKLITDAFFERTHLPRHSEPIQRISQYSSRNTPGLGRAQPARRVQASRVLMPVRSKTRRGELGPLGWGPSAFDKPRAM